METRTTRKNASVAPEHAVSESDPAPLMSDSDPPILAILPDNLSQQARIITLAHPATKASCRFLLCPQQGIFEFTRVSANKECPTSWLLAPETIGGSENQDGEGHARPETTDISRGYCIESSDLLIATPFDPIFLLLPDLIPQEDAGPQMFISLDDHIDAWSARTRIESSLLLSEHTRTYIAQRLAAVCDSVDAGDESMFKLSQARLAHECLNMARRMVDGGLPKSMEDKLVQEALRSPAVSVPIQTGGEEAGNDVGPTAANHTKRIEHLMRLRVGLSFICESYMEPSLRARLLARFRGPQSICDFAPLDEHLAHLETLRKEAQALRSISDNISRKRGVVDEEAEMIRSEKRRKKEEEELKKKSQSRGSKQLAKVNTSGMKKMSSFFAKKT